MLLNRAGKAAKGYKFRRLFFAAINRKENSSIGAGSLFNTSCKSQTYLCPVLDQIFASLNKPI
jgi:hypothetical protein